MSFKAFQPGCPCCTGCDVNFQVITCPGSYSGWHGYLPPELNINPSSYQVYLSSCSSTGTPLSSIYFPLTETNPTLTGYYTFKGSQLNNLCLVINANSGIFQNAQVIIPVTCNQKVLRNWPFQNRILYENIQAPCVITPLQEGATWYYTYNRGASKAALDYYADMLPFQLILCNYVNCSECELQYCMPSGGGCGSLPCVWSGPYASAYYKVFYNTPSVRFKVNTSAPVALSPNFYWSDVRLLYSYIVYYPSGQYAPCDNQSILGLNPVHKLTNSAVAYWQYAVIQANSPDPGFFCNYTCTDVLGAWSPNIQMPQNMDCGVKDPYAIGNVDLTLSQGWCGSNAFSLAEEFVNNLPTTLQYGEYGAQAYGNILESFSRDTGVINCPGITCSNFYNLLDCKNNPIFSGYQSLIFSPE